MGCCFSEPEERDDQFEQQPGDRQPCYRQAQSGKDLVRGIAQGRVTSADGERNTSDDGDRTDRRERVASAEGRAEGDAGDW